MKKFILSFLLATAFLVSCSDDEPAVEVIVATMAPTLTGPAGTVSLEQKHKTLILLSR